MIFNENARTYAGVRLTRMETSICKYLVAQEGYYITTVDLATLIFGDADQHGQAALRVHLLRLRAKLKNVTAIEAINGTGYRILASRVSVCPTCEGKGVISE